MSTMRANNRFPSQIKYIVGNEAAERFSFYGMRAILMVFMTTSLMLPKDIATERYHLFVGACYLLPLFGAWLSDRFLGKYRTIIYLSLVYCLGHLCLALFENETGLYWGLALIALGAGGIKPCVSSHVGDQFNESNKHLLDKIFSIFYFSINFGAFFSQLLIPVLFAKYGPSVAFGVPGILMALATLIFWMGRNEFVHVPPTGKTGAVGFMPIFAYALTHISARKKGQPFLHTALARFSKADVEGAQAAFDVFKVFLTVSVFWALFDQNGSSWVLQAQQMDLNLFGMQLEASQVQAINPILVMLMVPLFNFGLYPLIERMGLKLTPLRKMSAGMLIAALSFVAVAIIQQWIDAGQKPSILWQFVAFFFLTASEVLISITGLEFAYTQAPRSMKSTIMSFWLLTVFAGNMLTAYVAHSNPFQGAAFFWFFAALMFVVALVFVWSASRYKVREYIEPSHPSPSGKSGAKPILPHEVEVAAVGNT